LVSITRAFSSAQREDAFFIARKAKKTFMERTDLPVFSKETPVIPTEELFDRGEARPKTDLLLMGLAHDMRSPLFAMLGYLHLLQKQLGKQGTDQSLEYVQLAHQAGLRLDQMLTEALDVMRFGHQLPPVRMQTVRLRDLFERLQGTFQIISGQKQIRINMVLKGHEDVVLQADPSYLERALDNLVANAIKFSPAGGDVTLTGYERSGRVFFEVADRGRGIPFEKQPSIFEPFRQVIPDDRQRGFGLGLAIVRFIARAHGGDIEVVSEPGAGTCFTLWIPVSPARASPSQRAKKCE